MFFIYLKGLIIISTDPPKCVLEKDTLCDGTRILVFMDGLFHEGELKAIRPPDVYGAILDNERKTRPHYFSQEEILKDAVRYLLRLRIFTHENQTFFLYNNIPEVYLLSQVECL